MVDQLWRVSGLRHAGEMGGVAANPQGVWLPFTLRSTYSAQTG